MHTRKIGDKVRLKNDDKIWRVISEPRMWLERWTYDNRRIRAEVDLSEIEEVPDDIEQAQKGLEEMGFRKEGEVNDD